MPDASFWPLVHIFLFVMFFYIQTNLFYLNRGSTYDFVGARTVVVGYDDDKRLERRQMRRLSLWYVFFFNSL